MQAEIKCLKSLCFKKCWKLLDPDNKYSFFKKRLWQVAGWVSHFPDLEKLWNLKKGQNHGTLKPIMEKHHWILFQGIYVLQQFSRLYELWKSENSFLKKSWNFFSWCRQKPVSLQNIFWQFLYFQKQFTHLHVKVLVYSLALAAPVIHRTLQASHYLPVRELHWTFKEFPSAAHFAHL